MNAQPSIWQEFLEARQARLVLLAYLSLTTLCVFICAHVLHDKLPNVNWIVRMIYLGPLLLPAVLFATGDRSGFLAFVSIFIPLQVLAAFSALYTHLGLSSMLVPILVWANIFPACLHLMKHDKASIGSWILVTLIASGILLSQLRLGVVLVKLESESKHIVSYAYEQKLRTGKYPENLDQYQWRHDGVRNHFAYYGGGNDDKFTYPFKDSPLYNPNDKFSLRYHIGSENTAHWYSSERGWGVEDD